MIKNGQITKFASYSQFQTVAEFNEHMAAWLKDHGRHFSKSELIGLKQLTRYAVKVIGVANLKIGTALKTIHEHYNGNGISRSTFKRMLVKAKKIGLLTVHELKRDSGGQSSNLYIFMRYPAQSNHQEQEQKQMQQQLPLNNRQPEEQSEPPCQKKLNHLETKLLKTKPIKNIKNRCDELISTDNHSPESQTQAVPELDHTYTSDQVPNQFTRLVKVYYDNCETIEEYWRMAKVAAYQYLFEKDINYVLENAIYAFKQTIRKIKKTTVKKPIAYFYTIIQNLFAQHFYHPEEADADNEPSHVYTRNERFFKYLYGNL